MKRIVILPDVHLTQDGYEKPYELAKKFIKTIRPDECVILGDFLNLDSLSHWLDNKRRQLEKIRFLSEIGVANEELDYIQKYCNKTVYLEGNHERWTVDYLDANPQFEGAIEIPIRLCLKQRDIEWHELNTLYQIGYAHLTHGCYINKYHASKMLMAYGCCIIYGHTHNAQTFTFNMKMQDPMMAYGLGCLCNHAPYLKNRPSNWINQFGYLEVIKTGQFNMYPINILNNSFFFNNKEYKC